MKAKKEELKRKTVIESESSDDDDVITTNTINMSRTDDTAKSSNPWLKLGGAQIQTESTQDVVSSAVEEKGDETNTKSEGLKQLPDNSSNLETNEDNTKSKKRKRRQKNQEKKRLKKKLKLNDGKSKEEEESCRNETDDEEQIDSSTKRRNTLADFEGFTHVIPTSLANYVFEKHCSKYK